MVATPSPAYRRVVDHDDDAMLVGTTGKDGKKKACTGIGNSSSADRDIKDIMSILKDRKGSGLVVVMV